MQMYNAMYTVPVLASNSLVHIASKEIKQQINVFHGKKFSDTLCKGRFTLDQKDLIMWLALELFYDAVLTS